VGLDVLDAQVGAGLGDDDGGDRLHPARMADPEDGDLGDAVQFVDGLLDLATGDVLSARFDHVLLPVDDREVAVVGKDTQVAGVEPAATVGFGRLFLVIEVAQCRRRRSGQARGRGL